MLRNLKTPENLPKNNRNIQDGIANPITRPAVPVLATTPVLQRAKKKAAPPVDPDTDFVKQKLPRVNLSSIPDLPVDKSKQWAKDIKRKKNRTHVLKEMFAHLESGGLFNVLSSSTVLKDAASNFGAIKNKLMLKYVHAAADIGMARYTRPKNTTTTVDTIGIDFNRVAFNNLSRLYSVMRHELMHIGQYMMTPDPITDKNDPLLFELSEEWMDDAKIPKVDQKAMGKLAAGVKEIEPHIFELSNAHGSDIVKDLSYMSTTYHLLYEYLHDNILGNYKKLTDKISKVAVKGYLERVFQIVSDFCINHPLILPATTPFSEARYKNKYEKDARAEIMKVAKDLQGLL